MIASVATGKDRTGMTVRESTGNFLFGNRRYGKVREIFRPGMDGTGNSRTIIFKIFHH